MSKSVHALVLSVVPLSLCVDWGPGTRKRIEIAGYDERKARADYMRVKEIAMGVEDLWMERAES
jgi:hypothetical protein